MSSTWTLRAGRACRTSERGTGDAVVTYENELFLQSKAGQAIPYVIPPYHAR